MNEAPVIEFRRWRPNDIPLAVEPVPAKVATTSSARTAKPARALVERRPETGGTTHSITSGGVTATHRALPLLRARVAPSVSAEPFNTIKQSVVPLACWRAHDLRFEFESSFVLPEMRAEIADLKELIDRHTLTNAQGEAAQRASLTVFGHADPTGNDEFNKALSGRRAQAVYAMLTRKVELWEELHSSPLGNDKWAPRALEAMQRALGLPVSGARSKPGRAALFKAYMDHVCTVRDEFGQPALDAGGQPVVLELKATDFLADGADPGGKGDFQGCGEFNPILMFSAAEQRAFSDPLRKEQRDEENATNRRVLVFLFRPGVRIKAAAWPCPRASEGSAGCRKRFWSDAATRRTFQGKRRTLEDDKDTFACRFYDRLSNNSPCERGLTSFRIRLYDPAGKAIADAPFDLQVGLRKRTAAANADENGVLVANDLELPNRCIVRWGFPPSTPDEKPNLQFTVEMFLTHDDLGEADEARQKLHNIAYDQSRDPEENIAAFQRDYGHLASPPLTRADGELNGPTLELLRAVYARCAQDLRNTPPR